MSSTVSTPRTEAVPSKIPKENLGMCFCFSYNHMLTNWIYEVKQVY